MNALISKQGLPSPELHEASLCSSDTAPTSRRQIIAGAALFALGLGGVGCSRKKEEPEASKTDARSEERQVRDANDTDVLAKAEEKTLSRSEMVVRTLTDAAKAMERIEELARTDVRDYRDRQINRQSFEALYHPSNTTALHTLTGKVESASKMLRVVLEDPDFAGHRWHLQPLYVKANLITELLKNHEFVAGRRGWARNDSVDGSLRDSYEFRAMVTASVDQLKRTPPAEILKEQNQ